MLRPVVLGLLLVSTGCLRQNPGFDGADGDSAGATGSGGPATATESEAPTSGDSSMSGSGSLTGGQVCQSDDDCTDGLFCTGAETCDPGSADADASGCVSTPASCGAGTTCDEDQDACLTMCEVDADADDDGVDAVECGGLDCDDSNPDAYPGQQEVCDDHDVDEDCDPSTFGSLDADGDGKVSGECCNLGDMGLNCGDDCDDAHAGVDVGDWAHCTECGASCGVQQACEAGACVPARRVFVSSTKHTANLGGLAGADATCQARANEAALGGSFKAFIVDESKSFDRLEHPGQPFIRLDGVRIAHNWSDLTDGSLIAPLNLDEYRQPAPENTWTGLTDLGNGGSESSTCYNWTWDADLCENTGVCGGGGETGAIDVHWDGFFIFNCTDNYRLYCIEQ